MKIPALLNHPSSIAAAAQYDETSPSSTPTTTLHDSPTDNVASTTTTATSTLAEATNRRRIIKDDPLSPLGTLNKTVEYPTYEDVDGTTLLTTAEKQELKRQHVRFRIVSYGSGTIADSPRYIPYASEKKGFFDKTGRQGFQVFQYSFVNPNEAKGKEWTVMWDYKIGLVRITPFFKACGHAKTTPAKAIGSTRGLSDLCHSITGGALAAQGYWVPFSCARALCKTFCYDIRWVLTPIFGFGILHQCTPPLDALRPDFKIDSEVVRNATLESQSWRIDRDNDGDSAVALPPPSNRDISPAKVRHVLVGKKLPPRAARPDFSFKPPFDSDTDFDVDENIYKRAASRIARAKQDSPPVSPRSVQRPDISLWNSVNHQRHPSHDRSDNDSEVHGGACNSSPPTDSLADYLLEQSRSVSIDCNENEPNGHVEINNAVDTPVLKSTRKRKYARTHRSAPTARAQVEQTSHEGIINHQFDYVRQDSGEEYARPFKRPRRDAPNPLLTGPDALSRSMTYSKSDKMYSDEDIGAAEILLHLSCGIGLWRSYGNEDKSHRCGG